MQSPKERKKPGRKAETPLERLQRLEREMEAARHAVAQEKQQRLAAVGSAVIAEAEASPEFMSTLRDVLKRHVTSKAGRAAVASLLEGKSSPEQAA